MASLISERMRFLHTPKTGGTWATHAMFAAGVSADRPADIPFHATLAETTRYADRFTFAAVRHPLEFWRSYWGYRMRTGWLQNYPVDDATAADDLNEFAVRVIEHAGGAASRLYARYVGLQQREIDFICRHEHLADDLCIALELAGEQFDERKLRAFPIVNANEYEDGTTLFDPQIAERLAHTEREMIDRFYSWDPIPESLLA
jgi:hypothetical protein